MASAIRVRAIRPLPPPEPVPDMLYIEVDGTGVPVRRSETEGRQGKGEDGQSRTREIKLARLFTVSRMDSDGNPVTDPGSSSYVATFDGKDALTELVEAEYLRRGGEHFRQVVAIGDGAAWIWAMAGKLYPHATHIVDIATLTGACVRALGPSVAGVLGTDRELIRRVIRSGEFPGYSPPSR